MMKCNEMPYARPNLADELAGFTTLCAQIKAAPNADAVLAAWDKFEAQSRHLSTLRTLAEIRHTVDTRDTFYEAENDFFDENTPMIADKQLDVYRAMLASPYRTALETALKPILFEKMEVEVKSSSPAILSLMAEENALQSAYQKLYASAQIDFDGKKCTVSQMTPYKQSTDRAVRQAAFVAEGTWFDAHRAEFDTIYDKMVHNRTLQAQKLGYENYIPLGFIRMQRIGYTLEDMAAYRTQIKADVVPLVQELKRRQAKRIGAGTLPLQRYDNDFLFTDGNPTPKGTPEEILAAGKAMYHALSPVTSAFIDEMFAADLFDVLSKEGKAPGGYCTYLPDYKMPFIFSNFNATASDVDVLTHEAGHAFAAWIAAQKNLPSLLEDTGLESAEIHSMSMEFLTGEFHSLFFKEDTAKYALLHAESALSFLPYGTMVDEFQHIVYANPDFTPQQRNDAWKKLEADYLPWVDSADLPFYGRGAAWQRQLHIYEYPFYYIDYCLAQTVALQFFTAWLNDKNDAWTRYLALVNQAGTATYSGLVAAAGLDSPFQNGTMKAVSQAVDDWCKQENAKLQ
ncbi:MAG: M3 family oligoendopeptidase [Ruthenibacterium sp.]